MRDPIADLKHELMAAAERQQQQHAAADDAGGRWLRVPLGRYRLVLTAATVAVVAAAALVVSSPWKTAPGLSFLEEVQAAITPPEGEAILHAAWTVTRTSQDYGCTVTLGPNELWADLSPPYRSRDIDRSWPSPVGVDRRSAACDENASATAERGGTTTGSRDEVALLRQALNDGRAHHEGQVELDGHVVERIRVDLAPGLPLYFYVDPETFIPVQVEEPGGGAYFEASKEVGPLRFGFVRHYLTYEYLPRTDENLALTDIWAQHPGAVGRSGDLPTLSGAGATTVRVAKGATSARVTFEVTATDDEDGDIDVSCRPPSGSRFPLGETIVRCWAIDSRGNGAYAPFTVTVEQ